MTANFECLLCADLLIYVLILSTAKLSVLHALINLILSVTLWFIIALI